MKIARLVVLALSLVLVACSSTGAADGTTRSPSRGNLLGSDEIRAARHSNLYDVVSALRPNWLASRGPISLQNPNAGRVVVYLNAVAVGGAEYLRQVSVLDVVSAQYLSATEASARFGLRQAGGPAIVINTGPVDR